ncbi:3-oxoacyl-[acyl-carrier-protein] synthase III C-terminal domain-containing protein [Mycobacterium sp. 236(2023)]|uniref:type III polyketide synthase n=1 Tax=Mycobacterium sp. 236(2023) TaxID=3038163 RepID=UPI0024154D39|nr:3-oxoacyl-[acyl-carrier-protein] synthase III C-terminal domain-containing protein [Mycobacterium sp. 236(2023)]MDG4665047.1 3-oxoacyl-[acyl-carrier-protein] synthase III C-terminal domain-containing protein [Mycobacterium sp. 236(2023)]
MRRAESTVLAVNSAFPAHRYPQSELTAKVAEVGGLGPDERVLLDRLHANAGVEYRHTVLPLNDYARRRDIAAANDRYVEESADLGEGALRAALDAAGVAGRDLDLLIVTSVTGVVVPSLDARLIPRLGLRPDIKRLPVFGLGCVAGAAALARLHDYLLAWPDHHAALLAVELCSLSWPVTDMTTADLVVTGLFGDGAAALVATGTGARPGAGPRIVATRSEVYPDSGDTLGWRLAGDGFRIVLTAELADVVERHLAGTVAAFLAEHELTVDEIDVWVCHPGGPKVIDAVANSLKLPDSAVEKSRQSLAEVGNLSSASVLHILQKTVEAQPISPGSTGLMVGLGPGVSVELVLMRW